MAYVALQDVLVLVNVVRAPGAEIMIDIRTRPFIAVELEMPRMEIAITVVTMFSDAFGYIAVTIFA
jgi:hypothetical protein